MVLVAVGGGMRGEEKKEGEEGGGVVEKMGVDKEEGIGKGVRGEVREEVFLL